MAIAFDATSNTTYYVKGSYSFIHNCAGDNRILIVGDSHYRGDTNIIVTGVTYNGVALTAIRDDARGNGHSSLWYLIAPATGENAIVVTLSDDSVFCEGIGGAISYTGAKQSGQPDAHNGENSFSTDHSVTVTTIADNCWVVSNCYMIYFSPTCGNTQRWNEQSTYWGAGSDTNGPKTPAGAQVMGWTIPANKNGSASAASIAPAAGGQTILDYERGTRGINRGLERGVA